MAFYESEEPEADAFDGWQGGGEGDPELLPPENRPGEVEE